MGDKVHTVFDFWDCPRSGIASFNGKFHKFECVFDEKNDEYSNIYRLKELCNETLILFNKEKELKKKWDNKIYKSNEDKASFPILPEDKDEYELIKNELEIKLKINESNSFKQIARFHVIDEFLKSYNVEWKEI
jgi:hypothetical protein